MIIMFDICKIYPIWLPPSDPPMLSKQVQNIVDAVHNFAHVSYEQTLENFETLRKNIADLGEVLYKQ